MTTRARLDNGLVVLFEPSRVAKVAALQLWVNVGSADEGPGEEGLAHLHEHMLFKGTARRGPGAIARDIEAVGGQVNAWTSFDQTVYHAVVASLFAKTALEVLADAVTGSVFDADELAKEIEVVREEIKRGNDNPSRRASRALFETAFEHHPYGRPVIGFDDTVSGFRREDVVTFYERHYRPDNVVLVAVGDLSESELLAWAQETLGGRWGGPPRQHLARPEEPRPVRPRIRLSPDPGKDLQLTVAFHGPSATSPDVAAVDLLSVLGGQGEASRLSLRLKRAGLARQASSYAYTPRDPGLFAASLVARAGRGKEALEVVCRELAALKAGDFDDAEVTRARTLLEADRIRQLETVQGRARALGFFETSAGGFEEEAVYFERLAGLTTAEVRAAAERYIDFDRALVAATLPEGVTLDVGDVEAALAEAPKTATKAEPATPRRGAQKAGDAKPTVHQLPGGPVVVVHPERGLPLVALRAAALGGSRLEPEEGQGGSALLGRLLARGNRDLDAEAIAHRLDGMAGSLSGAAGRNSLGLRGDFLSRDLEEAFALFAGCLREPALAEEELERERAHLLQDIRAREDRPASLAFELFQKTLYTVHPYRRPVLGEPEHVEKLDSASLQALHARFLHPSALTLSVVGDVDPDAVVRLAERWLTTHAPAPATPGAPAPEPLPQAPRRAHHTLDREQTHLLMGYPGLTLDDPRRHTLEVLTTVLSGQGGRLFVDLRDKRSLAYSLGCYSLEGLEPGYVAVYVATSPEKLERATAGVEETLERLLQEAVGEDELGRARRHLIGAHEIGLQRASSRAALLALDTCYGLGTEALSQYAARVQAVGAQDVLELARTLIRPELAVVATVGR